MSLEAYTKATQAKTLAWHEYAVMPVDWLAAAGMVHDRLASATARLLAGDSMAYWDVVEALEAIYKRGLTKDDTKAIKAAVWHFIAPACQTCHGRGHPVQDDAPLLKEEDCRDCGGTGTERHKMDSKVYAEALVRLGGAASVCYYAIAKKVA